MNSRLLCLWLILAACPATVRAAILVTDVRIVDGTGAPARAGAVRIVGDRIVAVGSVRARPGDLVVNGGGHVLAPGFIDSHSHLDQTMFDRRHVPGAISQGVTTIIVGQDGMSPLPVAELVARLHATPVAVNVGTYSGHNDLRRRVMGDSRAAPTPAQTAAMVERLQADMRAGAMGLSTGLIYEPGTFSRTPEIITLAKAAAAMGGRYISHIRNESDHLGDAISEFLEIGRATRMPMQLSHIKIAIQRDWGSAPEILKRLDQARSEGIDVTADVYPYTFWQTTMGALFPDKNYTDPTGVARNFRETTAPDKLILTTFLPDPALERRTIAEIAAMRHEDPVTTYLALMAQAIAYRKGHHPDAARVEAIAGYAMSESDVAAFLAWPESNICSDGFDGGHPRGYGTFTRVLGRYVRETRLLTLEQAVHKMTGLTARHLGIPDRGVIRRGAYADLVLFDPATVIDRATIADSRAFSTGIDAVWVNGEKVIDQGEMTQAYPGRFITALPAKRRQGHGA